MGQLSYRWEADSHQALLSISCYSNTHTHTHIYITHIFITDIEHFLFTNIVNYIFVILFLILLSVFLQWDHHAFGPSHVHDCLFIIKVWFDGISKTIVGYLMPNPFLYI